MAKELWLGSFGQKALGFAGRRPALAKTDLLMTDLIKTDLAKASHTKTDLTTWQSHGPTLAKKYFKVASRS